MPAALLLCLSFLHVPGRARQDTGPGAGSAAWAPTARCGHQPLPSTPGLPAAARPSRRHVLSPEECAKSLPDVRDGRTTAPSVAHQGGQWALGTLQHPLGPNLPPDGSCLATGPRPSLCHSIGMLRSGRARAAEQAGRWGARA